MAEIDQLSKELDQEKNKARMLQKEKDQMQIDLKERMTELENIKQNT